MKQRDDMIQQFSNIVQNHSNRVDSERQEIEKVLSELACFKVTPWNFLKVLRAMKSAVSILGILVTACLTTQLSLNETLIDALKIMKLQQQQIDELRQ